MSEENTKKNSSEKMNFLMGLFVGMAAVAVVGFVIMMSATFSSQGREKEAVQPAENNNPANEQAAQADEQGTIPVPNIAEDEPYLGGKDAKIVLIEYTDLECPFCSRHHDTIKQILETYGDDVKYAQRHFPLSFHQNAQKAAEAVECAGEQGKFYEMQYAIFDLNAAGTMGVDKFKEAAVNLGLNTSEFNSCLDNGDSAGEVAREMAEGQAVGVSGTPATFINGQLVSGALPFENFQQIIDGLK